MPDREQHDVDRDAFGGRDAEILAETEHWYRHRTDIEALNRDGKHGAAMCGRTRGVGLASTQGCPGSSDPSRSGGAFWASQAALSRQSPSRPAARIAESEHAPDWLSRATLTGMTAHDFDEQVTQVVRGPMLGVGVQGVVAERYPCGGGLGQDGGAGAAAQPVQRGAWLRAATIASNTAVQRSGI